MRSANVAAVRDFLLERSAFHILKGLPMKPDIIFFENQHKKRQIKETDEKQWDQTNKLGTINKWKAVDGTPT